LMQEPISSEIQDGTLSIRILEEDPICTLSLFGELDLANAATLAAQLERSTADELILDMSKLEFIDSTGIALLVGAHRRLNGDGEVRFRLVASESTSVRRVLGLTGLDSELPFSENGHLKPDPGPA
jgi:anti-sigma B factor antagonist